MTKKTPSTNKRGSIAQLERRVKHVYEMLVAGKTKTEVKRYCKSEWGVSARTCEDYLKRARESIFMELHQDQDSHRALSLSTYKAILSSDKSSQADKVRAQTRIDKLLGLERPELFAAVDKEGNDLPTPMDPIEAGERILSIANRLRQRQRLQEELGESEES